jgi:pimeloyl-ACP methyl ester carboxylesterase
MKWLKRLLLGFVGLLFAGWLALVAWAYWPTGVREVPAASLAGPADRFVTVDGVDVRYQTWGQPGPDKPTALLIHGFANSLQSFRRVAPLLADRYYVVAYDMPGYGLSGKPAPFDYRNASQAAFASRLIRELGLKNVVVGGHSLGGAIALRVAVEDPEVAGLVVMNPGIVTTGVPPIAKYLVFPFPRLQAKLFGDPEFRSSFLKRSFVDPSIVTDQVVADLSRTSQTEGYMRGMTHLMGQYQDADEIPLLAKVTVPSLIVWGAQDRGKPAGEFEQLHSLLPAADTVYVESSGHYVQEEAPEETAAGMKALADRIMAGRTSPAGAAPTG